MAPKLPSRLLLFLVLSVFFLLGASSRTTTGLAHPGHVSFQSQHIGWYISHGDPVNLIFVGNLQDVLNLFDQYLRWPEFGFDSDADFPNNNQWCPDDTQRFTSRVGFERDHIRFKAEVRGPNCNSSGASYVIAAVHHEILTQCPLNPLAHVATNFNDARNHIADAFEAGGHQVRRVDVGNDVIRPHTYSLRSTITPA